ncbi:MAG: glycosyltransferase family 4 protein [Deltaproteobacteria bacterium]|nr:glycosyltransferase family 4 protein [Deltaproteobacteria bacterium]
MTRVLTFDSHEGYLYDLARTGFSMDVVTDLPGHHFDGWDTRMRPVPENMRLTTMSRASHRRYDCLIAHGITDLIASKAMRARGRVLVLHSSLDGRLAQEGARVTSAQMRTMLGRYMTQVGAQLVSPSEMKMRSWGLPARVIPFGVDLDAYGRAETTLASGLRVANLIRQKARYLRWELHEEAFGDLPMRLVGVNDDMPGVRPASGYAQLRELYGSHRFYVHTAHVGLEDGYNMASLEAMASGMPQLASIHPSTPVEDGISGYVSDDPAALREAARRLLADPELAGRLGDAAREAVAERFPMRAFVEAWREQIECACGRRAA